MDQLLELQINNHELFDDYKTDDAESIGELGILNLFVGANSVGKSRFLRSLFRTKQLGYTSANRNAVIVRDFALELDQKLRLFFSRNYIDGVDTFRVDTLAPFTGIEHRFLSTDIDEYSALEAVLGTKLPGKSLSSRVQMRNDTSDLARQLGEMLSEASKQFRILASNPKNAMTSNRVYVPVLRGMRPFADDHGNVYRSRTVRDYFPRTDLNDEGHNQPDIFTGLELYRDLRSKLLGDTDDRAVVREYERYLGQTFFEGEPVTLIPREGEDTVNIKIGGDPQLPIFHLGDGIQNLIIITYRIFVEKERHLFFIEEPDLFSHPGLQRALVESLLSLNRHQYFLTTHSNHLLDMSIDYRNVSVFHFQKRGYDDERRYRVRAMTTPDRNVLADLGVRNSSVFLTNATIWVEGITDRLYLRHYFKMFLESHEGSTDNSVTRLRQLKEDTHYSFVEYQGSNVVHWDLGTSNSTEAIKTSFLCGNPILIADGDIASKGERVENLKRMLGDRLVLLECKEIENLLPQAVVRVLAQDEFDAAEVDVNKIRRQNYSRAKFGLGEYLDKKLGDEKFGTSSGTMRNKVRWCEKAIATMEDSPYSLPKDVEELCNRILTEVWNLNFA